MMALEGVKQEQVAMESTTGTAGGMATSMVSAHAAQAAMTPAKAHDPASNPDVTTAHADGAAGNVAAPNPSAPLVLQCKGCRTIVGDTMTFVSTNEDLGIITLQSMSIWWSKCWPPAHRTWMRRNRGAALGGFVRKRRGSVVSARKSPHSSCTRAAHWLHWGLFPCPV